MLLSFQLLSTGWAEHYWQATGGRSEPEAVTANSEKQRRENMQRPPMQTEKNCVIWYFCLCLSSEMVRYLLALGNKDLTQGTWKSVGMSDQLSEMVCWKGLHRSLWSCFCAGSQTGYVLTRWSGGWWHLWGCLFSCGFWGTCRTIAVGKTWQMNAS